MFSGVKNTQAVVTAEKQDHVDIEAIEVDVSDWIKS